MYYYQLYHITLASEFPIEGLAEVADSAIPDVQVKARTVQRPPNDLPKTLYKPSSVANQDIYFLELENIARYQINGKTEVLIDIAPSSTVKDAMAFFFDTILTVLLLKYQQFVFHAAAIKGKEGAIMICTNSGGGKSALAMSLFQKGYEFIEDDRCLLHWDEASQQIKIRNYVPLIDVWKDVQPFAEKIEALRLINPVRESIQKYRYDASSFALQGDIPLQQILLITTENAKNEIKEASIKGMDKCRIAKNFLHLDHLVPYVSDPLVQFQYLFKTLSTIPITRITRSRLTTLKEFRNHIQTIIESPSEVLPAKPLAEIKPAIPKVQVLQQQLAEKKGSIVWLASYPKSGNTWFRCFLSALLEGTVDVNRLQTDGIFSSRWLLDATYDIDGRLLTEQEVKNRMPTVIRYYAKEAEKLLFCKIHDAYSYNEKEQPIIPADVSHKAIYLIRNPLDVVASYANHSQVTNDRAIQMMNKPNGYLARQKNGLNISNQLPQLMYSWSGHVKSWQEQEAIEVITVRYEDMKTQPLATFSRVVAALGLDCSQEQIAKAIALTQFEKLQQAEKKDGFKEKNITSPSFFRKGAMGGYKEELTPAQIELICEVHGETMEAFGYEIPVFS